MITTDITAALLCIGGHAFTRHGGIAIRVATAREIAGAIAGAIASRGASTLDTSGYIVARRQATVSSKITSKVMEVLIEGGQRVNKDQMIARLDESNYRTAYEQVKARVAQARANVHAAQVVFDNGAPAFERNKKQIAQGVIGAQAYDSAKAVYDALETAPAVTKSSEEVARAALAYAEQSLADCEIRAVFRCSHSARSPSGRNHLAGVCWRWLHTHGHRHDRRCWRSAPRSVRLRSSIRRSAIAS